MELELFFIFILGLVLGSFLNVVIYRVPRRLSVLSPARSYCPKCNRQLNWWENVPVLGWLFLGAKCRTCRQPISGQYPLVELLAGFSGVAAYLRFGPTPAAAVVFFVLLALIAITFIDFEFRIIPDVISLPGATLGLCLGIAAQYTDLFRCTVQPCVLTQNALDSLIGLIAGGAFFEIIGRLYEALAKREGIGGGDVKLMMFTGAVLGWRSVAPTIFLGSLVGSVVGIIVMLIARTGRRTEIAFGPWLSVGAVLYIFADLPYLRF